MATGFSVIAILGSGAGINQSAADSAPVLLSSPTGREMNQQSASASHQEARGANEKLRGRSGCLSARRALAFYQARVRYWTHKRLRDRGRGSGAVQMGLRNRGHLSGCPRYLAHLWQRKAHAARRAYERWSRSRAVHYRRLYEKWRCIHEHEGAWNSNTGNGYWGGLQMDAGFMRTYGPEFIRRWGSADRWPVWAQLEAAERAFWGYAGFDGRGYSPWGTRGACGV